MKTHLHYSYFFLSGLIFINLLSSSGQDPRPGIECGCDKYDNYIEPASKGILVEQQTAVHEGSSSKAKYTIEVVDAIPPNVVNITISCQGRMIFNESNRATGWGFSPDEDKFVMHGFDQNGKHWCTLLNLDPDPGREGEWAAEHNVIPPSSMASVSIRFSPHGKYLLYAAIAGTTGDLFLNIFDAKTGALVYDEHTTSLVGSPSGKSIAGWGFSPDSKDATFVHAYLTDVNKYTVVVKNLKSAAGDYVLFASNMQGEAHWFFSPCGDYFAWIIDSPYSDLECRLYRTDSKDTYEMASAVTWWKLFSAADGHYIRYTDNSTYRIVDNTADEKCPDETKPKWENALLDTGIVEGTTIELQWDGDTDNVEVTAYKIYQDGKLLKQIEAVRKYIVTNLIPDSSYTFKIEAGDEAGNWSTDGPEETFSTFPDNPPYWTDLTMTSKNKTETRINLTWKSASDDYGIVFYKILVNDDEVGRVGGDTLNYTVRGLIAGVTDTFEIEAGDAAGQWTAGPQLITPMSPAAPPYWPDGASLSDTNVTETSITVQWPEANDLFNAVTGYKIWMNGDSLAYTKYYIRELMVKDLEAGTVYSFEVIAYDESANPSDPLSGNLSTLPSYVMMPLIEDSSNQKHPDISGNLVVWWDDRNDEGDIYSYDLQTDSVHRITTDSHVQFNPAVSGDRIVWTDTRNGNWDIYMYDPVHGETPICTASGDQYLAAIDGDIIVWRDGRAGNWDIYMYNLTTMQESAVSTRSSNQNWPDVSGGYIVFADDRNGNWDIYMHRIYDGKEYAICTNSADQTYPVITGKAGSKLAIAYMDERNGKNIYVNYPFIIGGDEGYEFELDLDPDPIISIQSYPHFEDKQLVYQDLYPVSDGVTNSIWAYQVKYSYPGYSDDIKEISSKWPFNQTRPRTSKGNIVWQYDKTTDSDIYAWKRPPGSDLQLSMTELYDPARVGDTLKYILTLMNDGPNNNMFIETVCTIPQMVKYITAVADKGEVITEGKTLTWKMDTLRYESGAKLEIVMLTYDIAILEFRASVKGGAFDPVPSNNDIYETTRVKNVVTSYVDMGNMPAMVVEDNGKVHLVYFSADSTIKYAAKTRKGKWEYKVLGTCSFGQNISMVMDQGKNLHVIYSDYNWESFPASRLYHGVITPAGDWSSRIIAISDTGFHSLSPGVTADNELYLAYEEAYGVASPGTFKIRKTVNGIWQPAQTIFKEGYDHIDLAIDTENNPHLSFYNISQGMGILYQKRSGDLAGPVETIDSQWHGGQMEGMVTSIITDEMNEPHISYAGSINNDYNENIKHAWKQDDNWHVEKVDDGSFGSSGNQVALDPSGAINFAYNHHPTRQLRFATNIAGQWIRQIVGDKMFQWELEFEMDADRYGHIAGVMEPGSFTPGGPPPSGLDIELVQILPSVVYAMIPPLPYFYVDPDSLDFGTVEPDSTRTLILRLSNPSEKDIRIDSIKIDDSRFTFDKSSFILKRLDEDSVAVTFTQVDQASRVDKTITIIYNAPSGLMMEIPVKARPWQPALATDPEYISFGAVPKYTLETRSITLKNIGATDLIFSDINVKYELWPGYSIPTDFLLAGHNCSTLQPGETCEVQVSFQPNKDGTQASYLNISSNDPETPVRKISISGSTMVPQIGTDKDKIDLGYCPINQTSMDSLILINWGTEVLNITSVGLSGTDADQFSYTSSCTSIPSGDSCAVKVMMTPTRSGDLKATLVITSNSQYSKVLNIPLTGSSWLRSLELSAKLINFGSVNIGEQSSAQLELRNTGSVDLTVSIIQLAGPDIYEFSHNYDCYIISAGATCADTLFFVPIYEGSKTASLTISSNDSYEPEKMVVLTGQAGAVLPLQASISADPETGIVPLTVHFTSYVSGGQQPYQYLWDFKDGSTSTQKSPVHEFNLTGTYLVTLTATDINMQVAKDSVEVAVGSQSVPIVIASAQPSSGYIPLTVQFEAVISGGDAPVTVSWDFNDGALSQQQNPVHGFSFPGDYNVRVTVTDADGDMAKDSILITVLKKISLEGEIMDQEGSSYIEKSTVILYPEDWENGTNTIHLDQDHTYLFSDIESGSYTVQIIPDAAEYPGFLPTYLGNTLLLSDATWINVNDVVSGQNIKIIRKPDNPGGTGTITGTFIEGETGKKIAVAFKPGLKAVSGIPDCYVFLKDAVSGNLESYDVTGNTGKFNFDSVLSGSYVFEADYLGLTMDPSNVTLELSAENDSLEILAIAGISEITIELVETGLDNLAYTRDLKIYPVPASDRLIVEIANRALMNGLVRVCIYNLNGNQLIAEYPFIAPEKSIELNISNLENGFYLLRIEDKINSYEIRFIKAY